MSILNKEPTRLNFGSIVY